MLQAWLIKKPKVAKEVTAAPAVEENKSSPCEAKTTPVAKLQDPKKVLTPASNKDERKIIVSKDNASDDDADFKVLQDKSAGDKAVAKIVPEKPIENALKEIAPESIENQKPKVKLAGTK